ncbi:MAG: universal stress protein [Salibacteraceae bacterium]
MYKILVPYNFSESSKNALRQAGVIATRKNAKIIVVHVLETGGTSSFSTQGYSPDNATNELAMLKMIEKLKERLNLEIPTIINLELLDKIEVKAAYAEHTLTDVITSFDANLIVMGTKGFEGSKELFVSSNTQKTVDKSRVPVIVLKEKTPQSNLGHVVYASQFEQTHDREMQLIANFMKDIDADLDLIKVAGKDDKDSDLKPRLDEVARSLQFSKGKAKAEIIRSDNAKEAVQLYMDKQKGDLLVVNAHHIAGIGRFWGENTVEHFVNQMDQPMMLLNVA